MMLHISNHFEVGWKHKMWSFFSSWPALARLSHRVKMRSISLVTAAALFSLPSQAATYATINSQVRLAYAGSAAMYVLWHTFSQLSNLASQVWLDSRLNESISLPENVRHISDIMSKSLGSKRTPHIITRQSAFPMLIQLPYLTPSEQAVQPGDGTPYSVAVIVDIGTTGRQGLTTPAGKGVASTNVLDPKKPTLFSF
jgi:hypothetical protein